MNRKSFATFLSLIATLALAISPLHAGAQQLGFSNDDRITGCVRPNGRIYAVPNARREDCAENERRVALPVVFLGNAILAGYNLQVVNGSGSNTKNGLGNVIVGYNLDTTINDGCNFGMPSSNRTGSHNLIVGDGHAYSGTGGFVTGYYNRIEGDGASVVGGRYNIASGDTSVVAGGEMNNASGESSTVVGGTHNNRDATAAASCYYGNAALSGDASTVLGGNSNFAAEDLSTIDGSEGDGQTTP
jgi:hypothetical protein